MGDTGCFLIGLGLIGIVVGAIPVLTTEQFEGMEVLPIFLISLPGAICLLIGVVASHQYNPKLDDARRELREKRRNSPRIETDHSNNESNDRPRSH